MDNYPEELAWDADGGTLTVPFVEWWTKAKEYYRTVPENVAEQWIHRHWNNSSFGFLKSANYDFELIDFPTSRLGEILTRQANYHPGVEDRVDAGRRWVEKAREWHWELPSLMVTYRDFPAPIIVLDNLDGHVTRDEKEARREGMLKGLLLIEGHNRLDVASYLLTTGQFKPVVKVWMMKRRR